MTETLPQRTYCSTISRGSLPNLAIEGIFTFLFEPKSMRWGREDDGEIRKPDQTSADVERFCILRSLNALFWERSFEFMLIQSEELRYDREIPPSTILQAARASRLHLSSVKDIGEVDLSPLLSVIDLELWMGLGHNNDRFFVTPPPNLQTLKINGKNVDKVDLIQILKDTKIIELEMSRVEDIGRLDLSSLVFVKKLWLGDINGHFSLIPPPNVEILGINNSDIDVVKLVRGLKETKIIKLEVKNFRRTYGKGRLNLDLSSLLSLKDLTLRNVYGRFSLSPPPNVESLNLIESNIDLLELIHRLRETKIIRLEIEIKTTTQEVKFDISRLFYLEELVLSTIHRRFYLTAPPNLKSLKINCVGTSLAPLIQRLRWTKILKLEIWVVRNIGKLDLSSLLYLKHLKLWDINDHFSLTPPPNLESLYFNLYNPNMVKLIQRLKQTKIIKLKIWQCKIRGELDLSSLLYLRDLELWNVDGSFSMTPPPNLERFKMNERKVDMVGFNHSEIWEPAAHFDNLYADSE